MADLFDEINRIPKDDNFRYKLDELCEIWSTRGVELDGVEAILHFIELNPDLDFGSPGPLVHFSEKFHHHGYEAALLRSINRRPTPLTAWMLNRLINGTADGPEREAYVAAFEKAAASPSTDEETREEINHYLSLIFDR
ncbi:hypothetical protein ACSBM8_16145 [Sphingomonas sp. ASY06-1R]|jgi:hypothetical protein|uniref:hypothetical protein n=1 Tax=Sphingomonas sp. ASY06-1R TaxID=3445771 RepID=UPI003FA313CF